MTKLNSKIMTDALERAETHDLKGDVLARLWDNWDTKPEQRLAQFIYNAVAHDGAPLSGDDFARRLFYIEDSELLTVIEKFTNGNV